MALVKRFTLAAMMLILAAPIALAGPNAGGVLVLHDPGLAFTSDIASYIGRSGIRCGQDGPVFPAIQECPPYDPIGGASPCNPLAANPTSAMPAETKHVWYILAAFPENSCPRLKTLGFRIQYDANKVYVDPSATSNGCADSSLALALPVGSDEDGSAWPANRSGMGVSFLEARTSRLQEIWWFSGYAMPGVTDATFAVALYAGNATFGDDSFPAEADSIKGFGRLGFGGTIGFNPTPDAPSAVEKTSWGRLKATYGPKK